MNASGRKSQAGFTLVELIIATALGVVVLTALSSIVLTTAMGTDVAIGRMDASNEVRTFQVTAYDDIALSAVPNPSGCGTQQNQCTTQAMLLQGLRFDPSTQVARQTTVSYTWDPGRQTVTRQVTGAGTETVASNVSSYSWYVDSSGDHPAIVVKLTVTEVTYDGRFVQSATLHFDPQAGG